MFTAGSAATSTFLRISKLDETWLNGERTGGTGSFPPDYRWADTVERRYEGGPLEEVGVVGIGGLGHMGVKFAHAFGAHTVVFTTSTNKVEDAFRLGAGEVVVSRNADEMARHVGSHDFILDCVAAEHDINAYINLRTRDCT